MKTFFQKYGKWFLVALVAAAIIALLPFLRSLSPEVLLSYKPANPVLAALALVGLFCAKSVLVFLPSYAFYIVSGLIFPTWLAILLNYIGLACELSLGYFLGKWLGQGKVETFMRKNKKTEKILDFLNGNSQAVCFITRLLPMPYPVDLGSMFFGASGMPFFRHLLFSLLGFTAVMVPMTIAGNYLATPLSPQFLVPFGISAGIAIVLFVAYQLWMKRVHHK